ncbi:OmpH family outer membrane protein [Flavobacterium sp.]|uniref:OmpH family outer membrane protein n=1 Tax=Flavobacterium sp. TaxID=239 RepID=UPI003526F84F
MKKSILILGFAFALFSCNKTEETKSTFKTAYIDTSVLMEKYEKFKDEDDKFKVKSQEMGRPLEAKLKAFQNEAANFQRNAQAKGMAWAQQKGAELQQREQQLAMEQDALLRQIQVESDSIRTDLINSVKDYIKEYGKKQGYDYIYGTGDAATVLYAKDSYDITEDILKMLNDDFKKSQGKTEEKTATKTDDTEKAATEEDKK